MSCRYRIPIICTSGIFISIVFLGLLVSNVFSSNRISSQSGLRSGADSRGIESRTARELVEPTVVRIPRDQSFLSIRGEDLNPREKNSFVVSILLRMDKLPEVGDRYSLLMKTDDDHPYTGWGLGLRSYDTSFRPEVYWRDQYGGGGWFAFEAYPFQVNTWYSFSLVESWQRNVSAPPSIQLYIQEFTFEGGQGKAIPGDQKALRQLFQPKGDIRFLGGYALEGLGNATSAGTLEIGAPGKRRKSFRGLIGSTYVGYGQSLSTSRAELERLLAGGPWAIHAQMGSEAALLFFALQAHDESQSGRVLELSGKASWQPLAD